MGALRRRCRNHWAILGCLVGLAVLTVPAIAEKPAESVRWFRNLLKAFEEAKTLDKPMMICINAQRVDGGRREPAAKELRENTYKDQRIIDLAEKEFVAVFLTPDGTSEDYGELRLRYGIDGRIVSPQHIFAYPDGTLIFREEYWPHGEGEGSVRALLEMMQKALTRDRYRREQGDAPDGEEPPTVEDTGEPIEEADLPPAPEDGPERVAWIAKQIELVTGKDDGLRRVAARVLARDDRDGDCIRPLLALLEEHEKNSWIVVAIVRALGRPGLELAAPALVDLLKAKDAEVRGNAAVSLEYIGSEDTRSDIQRRVLREEDPTIRNHMWRAIGRVGAGEAKARKALITGASKAEGWGASYGPIIGLAYFPGDKRVARAVEKLLIKVGAPRGGRGSRWNRSTHRALLVWCLAEIRDPASADFMIERMIEPMQGIEERWIPRIMEFYSGVVEYIRGDDDAWERVEEGIRYYFERLDDEDNTLHDDSRRGRDDVGFVPKANWEVGGQSR